MTEYTLPDAPKILGTSSNFYFILRHANATLNIPTAGMIVEIGEVAENVDIKAGLVQMSNVEIVFREDYSDYVDGFWNTIIDDATIGDPTLELRIGYGGTDYDDTIFWGVLQPLGSSMDEWYVSGTTHKRAVRLLFVDVMAKLRDVTMEDLVTQILANDTLFAAEIGGGNSHYILVGDMVACMLVEAYGQTFTSGDVVIPTPDDIEYFGDTENAWHGLDELYVYTDTGYFLSSDTANYLALRYQNALDFLGAICRNFGVIARRVNDASGDHQIELLVRGDNYGTTITLGDLIEESNVRFDISERPVFINVSMENNAEDFAAWFDGLNTDAPIGYRRNTPNYITTGGGNLQKIRTENSRRSGALRGGRNKEPININWDLDIDLLWMANEDGTLSHSSRHAHTLLYVYDEGNTTMRPADTTRYYDYVAASTATAENYGHEALCKYYHFRYSSGRRGYRRTYKGLTATESAVTSFANLRALKRITIDDGLISATFYAQRVSKNLLANRVTIDWVQE